MPTSARKSHSPCRAGSCPHRSKATRCVILSERSESKNLYLSHEILRLRYAPLRMTFIRFADGISFGNARAPCMPPLLVS